MAELSSEQKKEIQNRLSAIRAKQKEMLSLGQMQVDREKEAITAIEAGAKGFMQGATFGFADEIEAFLKSASTAITGTPSELKERLDEELSESRRKYELAREAKPMASLLGDIAGSIIIPGGAAKLGSRAITAAPEAIGIGRGILSGAGRGARSGAAIGAVEGVGRGNLQEFSPSAIAEQAVQGAAYGGVGGGILGGAVGGFAGRAAKSRKTVQEIEEEYLRLKRMQEEDFARREAKVLGFEKEHIAAEKAVRDAEKANLLMKRRQAKDIIDEQSDLLNQKKKSQSALSDIETTVPRTEGDRDALLLLKDQHTARIQEIDTKLELNKSVFSDARKTYERTNSELSNISNTQKVLDARTKLRQLADEKEKALKEFQSSTGLDDQQLRQLAIAGNSQIGKRGGLNLSDVRDLIVLGTQGPTGIFGASAAARQIGKRLSKPNALKMPTASQFSPNIEAIGGAGAGSLFGVSE